MSATSASAAAEPRPTVPPVSRGTVIRTLLLATFGVPFVLASIWYIGLAAVASVSSDGPFVRAAPLLVILATGLMAPGGLALGLALLALRRWRGPLTRQLYAVVVTLGTLGLFALVSLAVPTLTLVISPLIVAAVLVAALTYAGRHRLGIEDLFDRADRPVDPAVFE